jgi:cob(I)alamin adenosyltransferase
MRKKDVLNVQTVIVVTANAVNMTITTRTGDKGVSYWPSYAKATAGKKDNLMGVSKDSILIETIGSLDEVQAVIGVCGIDLEKVMVDLWGIMGEISYGKKYEKLEERINEMEDVINSLEKELPKLDKFLIFEKEKSIKLNWVRTVVRKAERRVVTLSRKESVNPKLLAYINRLSDYLFMLARREEEKG